jgi:carboxymethylenebutenolidase
MLRSCVRLAGYGYVVVAPEIYHRVEPPGSAIPFDDAGRTRGLEDAASTAVAEFDADCRAALDYLARHPAVIPGRVGAAGFCIGGHLAFRAAMNPEVAAAVCFYATDIHKRGLAKGMNDNSLDRIPEIKGELLMIWGRQDPHIPDEGRALIQRTVAAAGCTFTWHEHNAQHAFLRDEGPRYDPALALATYGEVVALFRRTLG